MKSIKTVGVVGAGTMGSALAQKFAQEGFQVILADRELKFVENGLSGIKKTLYEGVEKKVFTSSQVDSILSNLKGTADLGDMKECDIIIEAIFEDFKAKSDLFKTLSSIVDKKAILATNTSSFSVTELAASVAHPERFIGLHYFYHAAKNRLVEIIPGAKTSDETIRIAQRFSFLTGKDAIQCADAYGFVVNRFFVPWLNEAVRLHEENIPIEIIEDVSKNVFGIGMGPFELMNATGITVAYHAEKTLETFGPLYNVAEALERKSVEKKNWEFDREGSMRVSIAHPMVIQEVKQRLLGVVFFICSQLLDEKVCGATEINRGAKIGLKWKKGPVEMMKEMGKAEVIKLIDMIAERYGMTPPVSVGKKFWESVLVDLSKEKHVAVITMNQPEYQNAFSEEMMKQLAECFTAAERDPEIQTIIITGSGKAFVAGADIGFFVKKIKSNLICDIESFTEYGQKIFNRIDQSKKKVVAVINGLALGGGLEFALCADLILALPKAQMAFPETSIGIYPGLGGTQRSVRKIGKGLSKYMIHTGKMFSAAEAKEIGLVDEIITPAEMFLLMEGKMPLPSPAKITLSHKWKLVKQLFENYSLNNILKDQVKDIGLQKEDVDRIQNALKGKAPVALRIADDLITKEEGCKSELQHLREVFSTSDALLGLTSIGKKVVYQGR